MGVLVHVLDVLLVHVRVRMGVVVVGVLVVVLDVCVGVLHVPVRVFVGVRQIGHRIAPIVVVHGTAFIFFRTATAMDGAYQKWYTSKVGCLGTTLVAGFLQLAKQRNCSRCGEYVCTNSGSVSCRLRQCLVQTRGLRRGAVPKLRSAPPTSTRVARCAPKWLETPEAVRQLRVDGLERRAVAGLAVCLERLDLKCLAALD